MYWYSRGGESGRILLEKRTIVEGTISDSYFYLHKSLCMSEKSSNFVPEFGKGAFVGSAP